MIKRAIDIAASAIGLVALSPVLALAVWRIRAETPGPAIFAQTRIGRNERPFTCYKLRTMYRDTGDRPSHDVGQAQVTNSGKWLRRYKLDEIPQLYNVLIGDMSLVGPRPCLPMQTELIHARRARNVFCVRPGITGLGQVRGIDMSDPELLATVDGEYIETRSLLLDLRLLTATVLGGGLGVDRVKA